MTKALNTLMLDPSEKFAFCLQMRCTQQEEKKVPVEFVWLPVTDRK